MKGFLAGLLVGLTLSVASGQSKGWQTGTGLLEMGGYAADGFRRGYAAGAADMLVTISGRTENFEWLRGQAACLQQRSGGRLSQFTDFAISQWRGRSYQAAGILLVEACK